MSFDNSHPVYNKNYVGMKKGNQTVIKEPLVIMKNSKSNIMSEA